jgi:hypothetical protein
MAAAVLGGPLIAEVRRLIGKAIDPCAARQWRAAPPDRFQGRDLVLALERAA